MEAEEDLIPGYASLNSGIKKSLNPVKDLFFFETTFTAKPKKMKSTEMNSLTKPTLIRLISAYTALLLILTSCGGSGNASTESDGANSEKQEVTSPDPFPTNLSFYDDLLRSSDCSRSDSLDKVTGPINCTEFRDAVIDFEAHYKTEAGMDYMPTKLQFDSDNAEQVIELLAIYGAQNDSGFVFHYGFDIAHRKIIYILSKGKLIPKTENGTVQFCPFDAGENNEQSPHFIALEPSGNLAYQIIHQAAFDSLTDAYARIMLYDNSAITNNHARMAYHDPIRLLEFYNEYTSQCGDADPCYLYIGHGAKLDSVHNIFFHKPCLAFGNSTEFFSIDNRPNTRRFENRGLNIGQLCPPNCPTGSVSATCQ